MSPSIQGTISLLEHIGQVGAEKIVPFADAIGAFINGFAPGKGDLVAKTIKAVGKAEADAVAAGNAAGTGAQKMADVVAAVSADVRDALGANVGPTAVQAAVEPVVKALNSVQVAAPTAATPNAS